MRSITLANEDCLSDEATLALAGSHLPEEGSYTTLLSDEDAEVYKPDGSVLLRFYHAAIPADMGRTAYTNLRTAAVPSDNRGMAGGSVSEQKYLLPATLRERTAHTHTTEESIRRDLRYQTKKLDGTLSNTNRAIPVNSGIVGYFDRNPRFPYCRTTAWNLNHPTAWAASLPFFRAVNAVFQRGVPDRYAAQHAVAEATAPDFYISGTAFTTITVNKNWQTAVHQDAGDLKEGFGVLSVLQAGSYAGANFVFPKYRVAVNIRSGDVLLGDVHEWHGNTPLVGVAGQYERISLVFYYRENMRYCGSAAAELERAKNRKEGDPLLKFKVGQTGEQHEQ